MIENSRYIPNDGEKEKLAKALGVDVDDIGWCRGSVSHRLKRKMSLSRSEI